MKMIEGAFSAAIANRARTCMQTSYEPVWLTRPYTRLNSRSKQAAACGRHMAERKLQGQPQRAMHVQPPLFKNASIHFVAQIAPASQHRRATWT